MIMSWNRGAERLFGYTAEEAVGKPVTILIPTDRHDEERVILERVRRGESVEHYETIRQRKDGSLKLVPMAELTWSLVSPLSPWGAARHDLTSPRGFRVQRREPRV
jgi:PAS domain S-box-containing protein